MNKYNKLLNNTFLFAVGTIGSKSISFLMLPVFTRILSPSEYGNLNIIQTTLTLLAPLISLQIIEAVFRFSMDKLNNNAKTYTNALLFSFCMFLLFSFSYPFFSSIDIFMEYIYYFYFLLLMSIVIEQAKHFVRGLGKVKLFAISDIFQTITFVILSLLFLVVLGLGLDGYFLALLFSKVFAFILIFFIGSLHSYISFHLFDKEYIKSMLIYSIPLIPNVAMLWVINSSDRYLVAYFLGLDATGIYSVAYKFPTIIVLLYSVFFRSWQMSAIEEFNSLEKDDFYSKIFSINCSLLLVGLGAFIVILKPLVGVMVADEFLLAWQYIPLLLIGVTFKAFAMFLGVGYVASKQTVGAFKTALFAAVVNIGFNVWLIPIWGIQGASFSTMIAFLVFWLFRVLDTKRYFSITIPKLKIIISFAIISFQSWFLFLGLPWLQLFIIELCLLLILFMFHVKSIILVATYVSELGLSSIKNLTNKPNT